MFFWDFAVPSCFPIMVSNGFWKMLSLCSSSSHVFLNLCPIGPHSTSYPLPKILAFNVNMKTKGKDRIIFHFGNNWISSEKCSVVLWILKDCWFHFFQNLKQQAKNQQF
jgi:hypothetical protein